MARNLHWDAANRRAVEASARRESAERADTARRELMAHRRPTVRQRRAIWVLCNELGIPTPDFDTMTRDDARAKIGSLKMQQLTRRAQA